MEFEWDLSKEMVNIRSHKITFSEAVESFFDPHGFQLVDVKHSQEEKRFYWVGKSVGGENSYNPIYPSRKENPDHRVCGVAKVQETLL